jgi:hypothetical protein
MSIHPQIQHPSTADHTGHCYTNNLTTRGVDESGQDWKRETGTWIEDREYFLDDDECECLLNWIKKFQCSKAKGIALKMLKLRSIKEVASFVGRIPLHSRKSKKVRIPTVELLISMNQTS